MFQTVHQKWQSNSRYRYSPYTSECWVVESSIHQYVKWITLLVLSYSSSTLFVTSKWEVEEELRIPERFSQRAFSRPSSSWKRDSSKSWCHPSFIALWWIAWQSLGWIRCVSFSVSSEFPTGPAVVELSRQEFERRQARERRSVVSENRVNQKFATQVSSGDRKAAACGWWVELVILAKQKCPSSWSACSGLFLTSQPDLTSASSQSKNQQT